MTDKERLDFLDKIAFKAGWEIYISESPYDVGPPLEYATISKSKCGKDIKSGTKTIRQAIDAYKKQHKPPSV